MDATQPAQSTPEGKTTLGQFADAYEILLELANQSLDGVTAAQVVRLVRWGRAEYGRYIEGRSKEVTRIGEPALDKDGKAIEGRYLISKDKAAEYTAAIAPLRAEPFEVEASLLIPVKSLGDVKISPVAVEIFAPLLSGL